MLETGRETLICINCPNPCEALEVDSEAGADGAVCADPIEVPEMKTQTMRIGEHTTGVTGPTGKVLRFCGMGANTSIEVIAE